MAITKSKPATGHTAGIYADMTLDGPEVGTLVAVIDRAKNLPNRKTMGKQDPYCAMRLGKEAKKTDTDRRGGQTPKWDQELRFTVHDSPDYYKLKCSVFNDDKKTDLIGEAWIDLTDLIKPGGGSNDLWHQLNYRGKYAGDVRIELTYYDVRPREEKASEKKKSRESTPVPTEGGKTDSIPRQLGPREVRRRPLPASPSATPLTQPLKDEIQPPPIPPSKTPLDLNTNSHSTISQYLRKEPRYGSDSYSEDFSTHQTSVQQYRQPFCEDFSPTADHEQEPSWNPAQEQRNTTQTQKIPSYDSTPLSESPHSWSEEAEMWDQSGHLESQHYSPSNHDRYRSPRTSLNSAVNSHDLVPLPIKPSTSPVRPNRYRDSPLRHSTNQERAYTSMCDEPEAFDQLPPPPPMHRDTPPRRPQPEYPPPASFEHKQAIIPFAPRFSAPASKGKSIDDRSALQQIERDYNPQTWQHETTGRRNTFDVYDTDHGRHAHQADSDCYELTRRQSSCEEYPAASPYDHGQEIQYQSSELVSTGQEAPNWLRSGSYDDRRSVGNHTSSLDQEVVHGNSTQDLSQTAYYKPQPVRPRPAGSPSNQIPLRKAVSTELYGPQDEKRLSVDPYSPDAYDVLNPASSPVTNEGTIFQTPKQARESARIRKEEQLKASGPIIGNDGREIDPSDHLPSDTWAPEPERKTRRPEHVIHYRTKNDSKSVLPVNLPQMSSRTNYPRQMPNRSPHPSPPALPAITPNANRNRLHKPNPTRSLPSQPHQYTSPDTWTNPRATTHSAERESSHQAIHFSPYQEPSPNLHRPQLSEYQVSAGNSYQPRGYQSNYVVDSPAAKMHGRRDFPNPNSNVYNDPLAAEMSMIDIGPGRSGQLVLSGRRGY